MTADIFDTLGNVEIYQERNSRFEPGDYECTITKCIRMKTKKRDDAFILEVKIADGTTRSWYQSLLSQSAEGNLKRFLYAALGYDPTTEEGIKAGAAKLDVRLSEIVRAAVSEDNILAGRRVRVTVEMRDTKSKTPEGEFKQYRHHIFRPLA